MVHGLLQNEGLEIVPSWLLERLRCPEDNGKLSPLSERELTCAKCRRVVPIHKGIPVFLPDRGVGSYQNRQDYPPVNQENPTIRSLEAGLKLEFELISDLLPGSTVLDIGSGGCFPASYLAARYPARVVALDPCLDVLDRYGSAFLRYFATPQERIARVSASAYELPFDDGSFDLVVGAGYLHHFEDLGQALAEIHRVLRPGGVVFACSERLRALLRPVRDTVPEDQLHTRWSWRWKLTRSGFTLNRDHVMAPTEKKLSRLLHLSCREGTWGGVLADMVNAWLLGHSVTFLLHRKEV